MKRFTRLYEKIISVENLFEAHKRASAGKKHYKEVQKVEANLEFYLNELHHTLATHSYKVSAYTKKIINERGKERVLHKLPYYPDRIIQWAIMLQIEFIFTRHFCFHTCASLANRGIKRAARLSKRYASLSGGAGKYCLKFDIAKFYDNIDHATLKAQLATRIKDKELMSLLCLIISSFKSEQGTAKGLPIGSYLSQYLANFYLSEFDHFLKEKKHQKFVVRYMDDICIFGRSKKELHDLLRQIKIYLKARLKLDLKSNYQIYPVKARGVDFVGFRFFKAFTLLRKSVALSFKRLCARILKRV